MAIKNNIELLISAYMYLVTNNDWSNALKQALNDLPGNGGNILLDSGEYLIDLEKIVINKPNVLIIGKGKNITIIKTTALPTVLELTEAATGCTIKDLSIESYYEGNINIKIVNGYRSFNTLLENFKICLKHPKSENYDDICLFLDSCYYSKIVNCDLQMPFINSINNHAITNKACYRLGGTGLYATNNNALDVDNTNFINCGTSVIFDKLTGAHIIGGSAEHFNRFIYLKNNSINCNISNIRLESSFQNIIQILPYGEQWAVKFEKGSIRNTVQGYNNFYIYNIHHPYNVSIIDENFSGLNIYDLYKPISSLSDTPIIKNGDFKYSNGNNFDYWKNTDSRYVSLEKISNDVPAKYEYACKITASGWSQGIISTSLYRYIPNKSHPYISMKVWIKVFDGNIFPRIQIFNTTTNDYVYMAASMYVSGNIAIDFPKKNEWQEYSFYVDLSKVNAISDLQIKIATSDPTQIIFAVAGIVCIEGYRSIIPEIFETPFVSSIPTTGSWNIGDKIYLPPSSGWIGAICIQSGTPGVWKKFGELEN